MRYLLKLFAQQHVLLSDVSIYFDTVSFIFVFELELVFEWIEQPLTTLVPELAWFVSISRYSP